MLSLSLKLLLVSGDPRLKVLIQTLLDERPPRGHTLTHCECLEQVLVQDDLSRFDVAIVELVEPGLDWLAELKLVAPRLSVIVLNSEEDPALGLAAIREGAHDYLDRRHLNPDALLRVIRYAAERGRVEWALRESQSQLLQAQKMEAIGRMTAGLVHDFRQFTQIIVGDCGLLSSMLKQNPEVLEVVEEIREAGLKARRLVEQLLNFARPDSKSQTRCDLNEVVREHQAMVRSLLATRTLHLELAQGQLPIDANTVQLGQILLNLVVNAVDATPGDGWLQIQTRPLLLERPYQGPTLSLPAGAYAVLEVTDSGTGLDEALRSRVFEPFFTTKARGHGTGLGLSTVFSLTKSWGGWLDFGTLPGRGTTFRTVLPMRIAWEGGASPPKAAAEVALWYSQDTELLTIRRDLEALGCHVTEVSGPAKGDRSGPDCYLVDLKRALDWKESPPRLVVVGSIHPRLARSVLDQDAAYLMAPFSRAELAALLAPLAAGKEPASRSEKPRRRGFCRPQTR